MRFDLVKRDPDSFFVIFDQTDFFQCLNVGMSILHVPIQGKAPLQQTVLHTKETKTPEDGSVPRSNGSS